MRWPVRPLGELAETALGKMLDKGKSKGLPHVPYLRNVNVQWGRINTDDLKTMELADDERERFGVRAGDLLVCEGGEIGRCAIWHGRADYIAYQKALHRIRPGESLDVRFLRYLLEHHSGNGTLGSLATGSTIAHLPQQQLRRIPVPHPPLDEQCRIVDLLEDHLSRLDAAESSLLLALRKSNAMVTSSLVAQTTAERPSWLHSTVGAEAELVEYGASAKCVPAEDDSSVPVLRMGNLRGGALAWDSLKYLPSEHEHFPRLLLRCGDLLFNRTNSAELVGKSAVFEDDRMASFASYLIRVRFKDAANPKWANMVINSPMGRRYVASVVSQQVGQANVNSTKLKAFPLPLPTREEQDRRVREHNEVLSNRGRLRDSVNAALSRSAALRRSLLTAAFSGRLTGAAPDLPAASEMVTA